MKSSFKKTALATVVAGALTAGVAIPQAQADVIVVNWRGAFTMLNPAGAPFISSGSDYVSGYYANGNSSNATFGTPTYTQNPNYAGGNFSAPYATTGWANGAVGTGHAWYGNRTPISGTMSFDLTTGAGTGTVNPFYFFGDGPTGLGSVASALGISFATIDTVGTLVGAMLFSWNGGNHSVSIVLDASGMFQNLNALMGGGPTNTISGVGALPASDGTVFGATKTSTGFLLPLGASPVATKSTNAIGCEALTLATSVNAYTIVRNNANIGLCDTSTTDAVGGSPMSSAAFSNHNANFDISEIHFASYTPTPTAVIPVPAAVWLFGSGLLGLVGIARRKKKA
jgi:hypothetical protein